MEWPILTRRVLAVPIKGAAAVSCARLLLAGFCFCVPVPWAVTLGLCGSLGMVLTHFIDHLNRMGGMTIDGYTLGQYCDRLVLLIYKCRYRHYRYVPYSEYGPISTHTRGNISE